MTLQETLKKDLMASKDTSVRKTIRIIMGELARQRSKDLSDLEVERIIKKIIVAEEELLEAGGQPTDVDFLPILKGYLPEELSEETIINWITENVDFSSLKNKMQAIGIVTKHFGSAVDGKVVKEIILKKF